MVTTDVALAPHKRSAAVNVTLLVAGLTATGMAIGAIAHGLARGTPPHPTLTGTVGEAASILVNNARVLIAPFALWALGFPSGRATRRMGDLIVFGVAGLNSLDVGVELGRWGLRLVPYVPQLPLEWAALTVATAAWLKARTAMTTTLHMLHFALVAIALLIVAAAMETWGTPHVRTVATSDRAQTSTQIRWLGTAVSSHPDFAPTTALSLQGRLRLPSPHRRSVPLGRLVGADRAHINHRPQSGGIRWTSTASSSPAI
jgi:hypothetical protein